MPMQPSPRAETSGPFLPRRRFFMKFSRMKIRWWDAAEEGEDTSAQAQLTSCRFDAVDIAPDPPPRVLVTTRRAASSSSMSVPRIFRNAAFHARGPVQRAPRRNRVSQARLLRRAGRSNFGRVRRLVDGELAGSHLTPFAQRDAVAAERAANPRGGPVQNVFDHLHHGAQRVA